MILFLLVLGMLLWILGYRNHTDNHPGFVFFNPKYWLPVWRTRAWYTSRGYRQMIAGCIMVAIGGLVGVVLYLG